MSDEEISSKYDGASVSTFDSSFFDKYNFNRPIDYRHRWGNHQNPKYFYAHFRMLCYYIKNPDYKYYWFFDDDVEFEGDLKGFLDGYEAYEDDFMAIQAFGKELYPEYNRMNVVSNRMRGSHGSWLWFAPGPGDNYKSTHRHMGCFFPIVRFSNRALAHLFELNNQGFYGYHEGFVPTALASDGFYVSSMMKEDDTWFIQPTVNCELKHKKINFTWAWL